MLLHSVGRSENFELGSVTDATDLTSEASFESFSELPKVLILYGSQTGNAEAAARRLKRELRLLKPVMMTLNDAEGLKEMVGRNKYTHVLAVCSTFGDGSPPANAYKFFETELPRLCGGQKFAVLGLGSTIYPRFCQAAVTLDQLLRDGGLEPLITLTKADEAAGADGAIDDWIKMTKAIIMPLNIQALLRESSLSQLQDSRESNKLRWLPSEKAQDLLSPVPVSGSLCLSNQELVGPDASRPVRKVTFRAPSKYESGDHLSVMPVNSDTMVRRFLQCFRSELQSMELPELQLEGDLLHHVSTRPFAIYTMENGEESPSDVFFETPTTLGHLLKRVVDLSLSSKDVVDLVRLVKEIIDERIHPVDVADRETLLGFPEIRSLLENAQSILDSESSARTEALDAFISRNPTIVDFLENHRECLLVPFFDDKPVLELGDVLCVLTRLQPRFYSISSSNKVSPDEISITVGVLQVETSSGVKINGVCSNYLAGLEGGKDEAIVSVHKSSFRLPSDPQAPIMMVGAGTGLAPMMGFLGEKALDKQNGEAGSMIHLFFGCRTSADFIYKSEIEDLENKGLIDFHLALSRSGPKMYVQDKIKELGREAADLLLRKETHYYVCGDAQMANSCYEYCIDVLRTHAVMSRVSAAHHLKQMQIQGRWQSDVWGILSNYESSKKNIMNSKRKAAMVWMQHFET